MAGTGPAVLAMLGTGLIDPGTPVVRIDDAGLTRGDGCFEGCRLRLGPDGVPVVDKLDAHLARMTRSAAALGIPFDEPAWRSLVAQAVSAWTGPGEAAVKLLLTRGAPDGPPAGFVAIGPVPADYARLRRDGLSVVTLPRGYGSAAFAEAPWLLGGVKSLSYAINMAAQREATRRGADDALFVSADGLVLESPTGRWSGRPDGHCTRRRPMEPGFLPAPPNACSSNAPRPSVGPWSRRWRAWPTCTPPTSCGWSGACAGRSTWSNWTASGARGCPTSTPRSAASAGSDHDKLVADPVPPVVPWSYTREGVVQS